METFQQPKIIGYRQLNESDAMLMNEIKSEGMDLEALCIVVNNHIREQKVWARMHDMEARAKSIHETGEEGPVDPEQTRIEAAQPERWAAIARTHFQEGLMALTRAVAQPGSF